MKKINLNSKTDLNKAIKKAKYNLKICDSEIKTGNKDIIEIQNDLFVTREASKKIKCPMLKRSFTKMVQELKDNLNFCRECLADEKHTRKEIAEDIKRYEKLLKNINAPKRKIK